MALCTMKGRYLGRKYGSFVDKTTQETVNWGKIVIWDDVATEAVEVKCDSTYLPGTMEADFGHIEFGDEITIVADIRPFGNKIGYKLRGLSPESL